MLTFGSGLETFDAPASPATGEQAGLAQPADDFAGTRAGQQHPIVLAASAQAIDRSSSLLIADLCHQGIKLKGPNLPALGQEVLITTGTFAVFAHVARFESGECDLSFLVPLDEELLDQFEQDCKWATIMGIV